MNIPVLSTDVSMQTLDLFAFLPLYVLFFFIMKLLAPAPYKYWKKSSTALLYLARIILESHCGALCAPSLFDGANVPQAIPSTSVRCKRHPASRSL